MTTPTCVGVIPNPQFKEWYPAAPSGIPRGNLLEVAVNPYNGQFVVSFQRSDEALELINWVLGYIEFQYGCFDSFARPLVEGEPRYVLKAVS